MHRDERDDAMTRAPEHDAPQVSGGPPSGSWEDQLRAGQAEAGESGPLDDELAVVELLRHVAAPPELTDLELARGWKALGLPQARPASPEGLAQHRWVTGAWLGAVGVLVAAAILAFVMIRGPRHQDAVASLATTLESQFLTLLPGAAAEHARFVEGERRTLRTARVAALVDRGGGSR